MVSALTASGQRSAVIVLGTLFMCSVAGDYFTTARCKKHRPWRVRQYPVDGDARTLQLDDCSMTELNKDDIVGLPNITEIEMPNNAIVQIDLTVFRFVPTLKSLSIANNKLRELPAFPEHSCPSLIELNLHINKITAISHAGTFSECARLKVLSLYTNKINYIHPNAFSSLTELEGLYLDNNEISFIPDQMFAKNTKLQRLLLQYNRLMSLPQGFVGSFKNAGVGLDIIYFHNNPWHCACLLELLSDVKRAGVSGYDFWHKYKGKRPECMFSGADLCVRRPPAARNAVRESGCVEIKASAQSTGSKLLSYIDSGCKANVELNSYRPAYFEHS